MPAADALTSGTWLDILDAVVFSPFAAGGSTGLLLRNLFSVPILGQPYSYIYIYMYSHYCDLFPVL